MTRGSKLHVLRFRPGFMAQLWRSGIHSGFSWLVSRTFDKLQPLRAEIRP